VSSRRLDDTVLTLGASGWTYRNTFVLHDRQTGSMWLPRPDAEGVMRFEGIAGEHAGRALEPLPFFRGTWRDWTAAHPGSGVALP